MKLLITLLFSVMLALPAFASSDCCTAKQKEDKVAGCDTKPTCSSEASTDAGADLCSDERNPGKKTDTPVVDPDAGAGDADAAKK
jgi:hypothetical protein